MMNGLRPLALLFRDLREAGHCRRDAGRQLARLVGVRDVVDAEEPAVRVAACEGRAGSRVGFLAEYLRRRSLGFRRSPA